MIAQRKPHTERKERVVTFLGRITMQKGPEYFVEAASLVLQRTRNVRFCMAGSGDMLNAMIEMAAQKGIADRFFFPGFMKGKQVYEVFRDSDVYVMPSVSEPFGISRVWSAVHHQLSERMCGNSRQMYQDRLLGYQCDG